MHSSSSSVMFHRQSPHTINSVVDTAVMVLKWSISLPLGGDPSPPQAVTWMLTLNTQVGMIHHVMHHMIRSHDMTQVCSSMQVTRSMERHMPTVIEITSGWIFLPWSKVVDTAKQDVEGQSLTHGLGPATARDLHDVTLACTVFGYRTCLP